MGNNNSNRQGSQTGTPEERAANRQISAIQRKDKDKEFRKIKLLLLGTGESGKSTFVKQVRNLYGRGISDLEREEWEPRVYENINGQVLGLITGADNLGMPLNPDLVAPFKESDYKLSTKVDEKVADQIEAFWKDDLTQKVWDLRSEYQILDCIEYYIENLNRISKEDYIPTFQDIVQTRVRTTGIVTEKFAIDSVPFELYDVGGQRNERKKWINCFDNVTTVIFVVAINEYDQKLFEDATADRVEEALTVFEQVVNNPVFENIGFIVFLNKFDLFETKLFQTPYRVDDGTRPRNTDFEGPHAKDITDPDDIRGKEACVQAAAMHMQERFEARADTRTGIGALTYHHTNATDTSNVEIVFKACKDQILRVNLAKGGFAGRM